MFLICLHSRHFNLVTAWGHQNKHDLLRVVGSLGAFSTQRGFQGHHVQPDPHRVLLSREFRSDFKAHVAAGVSPEKISMPSEVRREHVGMRAGDWYCYDCQGFVWRSKTVCDSFKCQRRRQEKGISASKMVNSFRTVSIAVDDEEDAPCPTDISPMANERAELKDTSFVLNVLEDPSCSTDNSSVAAYARSGEQAELKRARGVRDPACQREILANRKIVWHADKGIWVELDAPGGSDQNVEATTEV